MNSAGRRAAYREARELNVGFLTDHLASSCEIGNYTKERQITDRICFGSVCVALKNPRYGDLAECRPLVQSLEELVNADHLLPCLLDGGLRRKESSGIFK